MTIRKILCHALNPVRKCALPTRPGEIQGLVPGPLFLVLILIAPAASSDWINLTGAETSPNIAEIYVLDDQVRLAIEVSVGDLETFEGLVPDDWLEDAELGRPPLEERMRRFAERTFQVLTAGGDKLPARVDLVEPRIRKDRQSPFAGMVNPYTRQRVPEAPADKRVLYAEISYPFEGRPAELTFVPPLDEEGRARVTIGFIAYHKAVPVIDFRYLGAPARLILNWDDPWYSGFDNPNLKRHHKDALMSYLYVEPYEVRHEVLTRVRDLEQWMDLGLRGDRYIEPDELGPLKGRIGEFFLDKNPLLVDGKALKPILDRTNYVRVGLKGIQTIDRPERLEISTAIVGVILAYITDGMPREVSVDWELFTDRVQRVPATATDPAGPLMSFVTPEDKVHTWTNFLKNFEMPSVDRIAVEQALTRREIPLASLLLVLGLVPVGLQLRRRKGSGRGILTPVLISVVLLIGAGVAFPFARVSVPVPGAMAATLSEEQGRVLLASLLKNLYRAFDFRQEEHVYDKLALSASGDLLADIYLQNRKSFAVQQAGGAQAKVKEIEVLDLVLMPLDRPLAYRFDATWTAEGSVGHWGHVHRRKNRYQALVTVEAQDGAWKITGLELLDEKRIDPAAQAATLGPRDLK